MNPTGHKQEQFSESSEMLTRKPYGYYPEQNKIEVDRKRLRKKGIFIDSSNDTDTQIAISAIKQVRTLVMSNARDLGVRSLMVTGPTEGIGKSTLALNLAIYLSRMHITTFLIDLDLRCSSLMDTLGVKMEYGSERIGDKDFSMIQATLQLGLPNLFIVPCADRVMDSSERLCTSYARTFFSEFPSRLPNNSFVIYDTPPVLGCDDVPAILSSMESVVMVVEEGRTSRREVSDSLRLIQSLPLLGTVMNKSRDTDIRKYYY